MLTSTKMYHYWYVRQVNVANPRKRPTQSGHLPLTAALLDAPSGSHFIEMAPAPCEGWSSAVYGKDPVRNTLTRPSTLARPVEIGPSHRGRPNQGCQIGSRARGQCRWCHTGVSMRLFLGSEINGMAICGERTRTFGLTSERPTGLPQTKPIHRAAVSTRQVSPAK